MDANHPIKVTLIVIDGLTVKHLPDVYSLAEGSKTTSDGRKVERTEVTIGPPGAAPIVEKAAKDKAAAEAASEKPAKKAKKPEPEPEPEPEETADETEAEAEADEDADEEEQGEEEKPAKKAKAGGNGAVPAAVKRAAKLSEILDYLFDKAGIEDKDEMLAELRRLGGAGVDLVQRIDDSGRLVERVDRFFDRRLNL